MTVAIVLAAGKGTRMRSALPKVAHNVAGMPMIAHVHRAVSAVPDLLPLYVLGHMHDVVRGLLPEDSPCVLQSDQRGTGHAVTVALEAVDPECDGVMVLYGDMPLVTAETLVQLRSRHQTGNARLTLLSAIVERPEGYGRIIRDQRGVASAIVEEKWLTDDQRAIAEINTGLYVIDAHWLRTALPKLPRHGDDEIYLTDLAELAAVEHGLQVVTDASHDEILGINDRIGLAHAELIMRRRINERIMAGGVTLIDPATTYIAADATIGSDTVIEPNVIVDTGVTIGERCHIGSQSRIVASAIGNDCAVYSSHIEFSEISDRVRVGPFSHLRAGTTLDRDVHIGNFAEIKNSSLGEHTKVGHFSYLGDASLGARVNVGAGTITANFDGTTKHKTEIGDDASLGVGTLLRAPVTVGAGAYTGAGSVVLQDIAENTTVVGTPAKELRRRGPRQGDSDHAG